MTTTDEKITAPLWRSIINDDKTIATDRLARGTRVKIRARASFPALAGMQMKCQIDAPPVEGVLVDRAIRAASREAIAAGDYSIEFVVRDDKGEAHTREVPMADLDLVDTLAGDGA